MITRQQAEQAVWASLKLLGLYERVRAGEEVDADAVHEAFRLQAREHHPDTPTGSEDAFRRLNHARDLLERIAPIRFERQPSRPAMQTVIVPGTWQSASTTTTASATTAGWFTINIRFV